MRRRARVRLRATVVALLAVVGLLLVTGPTPAGTAPATPVASPSSAVTDASTSPAAFAARAGFAGWRDAAVPNAGPAQGTREIVLTFQARDPAAFAAPEPGSRPLTAAQVADRFGLAPTEYVSVERFFESQGFSVLHAWPDRLSLSLVGSVAEIDRTFGTTVLAGTYQGRNVSFPVDPPSLPPSIESMVASVVGLSTGFDPFVLPAGLSAGRVAAAGPSQGSGNIVTPAIARQIYQLSPLYNVSGASRYATSKGIALLLWGPGYAPSDLSTFYQRYYPASLFPNVPITPVPVDGAPAPASSAVTDPCGAAQELTLDLEWSGSMAPGANLYAVYAPGSAYPTCSPTAASMADALHTALGLPITAISMSFGTPESSDASLSAAWSTDLSIGAQEGITMLAATGDLGGDASPGCSGGPDPQYPSTSPDVLAVGGTDVTLVRNILGQIQQFSETAWNDSGGGFSTQFPAPSWQNTGNPYRGTPDVSATAGENFLYYDGQSEVAAGTSFATPLWAGLVTEMAALSNRSLAPLAPRLYSIAEKETTGQIGAGLVDITSGATCLGSAGPGWDPETGWGSPRALLLFEDLTSTFVSLSLGLSSSLLAPGGSVTISGHLANLTSRAPLGGIPVRISLSSSTDLGPCTGTFGTATLATNAEGNVSTVLSVPACYLGSSAVAEVAVLSNGYYGTNSTSIAVNLIGFVPFLAPIFTYPYSVAGFAAIFVVASAVGYVLGRPPRRPTAAPGGPASAPGSFGPPPEAPPPPAAPPPAVGESGPPPAAPEVPAGPSSP